MLKVRRLWRITIIFTTLWAILHTWLRPRQNSPFIIGHRGAAGLAPENTLAALREGIRQGAKFLEVDLQRSADGQLLIFHDTLLERTTNGLGALCSRTWEELRQLDAGSYFSPDFAGERIPLLAEALALIMPHAAVTLVIEAKDPHTYPYMARDLAEMLTQFQAEQRVIVISFDHVWLSEFHRLAPRVPLGALCWGNYFNLNLPTLGIINVDWPRIILDPTFVSRMHGQGNQVWVYTVNDLRLMRLLAWLGVSGLTTDYPNGR